MIAQQIAAIEQLGKAIDDALDSDELDLAIRQHVLRDKAIRDVLKRYDDRELMNQRAALEAVLQSIQKQQIRAKHKQEHIAQELSTLRRRNTGGMAYAAAQSASAY